MKISYECSELIEDLEEDIREFGNIDMYAFFDKIEGYTILTNYDFISNEIPLNSDEIENSTIVVMKAEEILKILQKQNSIL